MKAVVRFNAQIGKNNANRHLDHHHFGDRRAYQIPAEGRREKIGKAFNHGSGPVFPDIFCDINAISNLINIKRTASEYR
jgi:hypothetical protein